MYPTNNVYKQNVNNNIHYSVNVYVIKYKPYHMFN